MTPPAETEPPNGEQTWSDFVDGKRTGSADKLFGDLGFIADLDIMAGWDGLPPAELRARFGRVERRLAALAEVAAATVSRPGRYHPGDAAAIVCAHTDRLADGLRRSLEGIGPRPEQKVLAVMAAQLELTARAVPYWMPPAAGAALAASHPPEERLVGRLRLPYPAVLLVFGAPLVFGPAADWATSSTDGNTHWKALHDEGGTLHAVVLLAHDDGQPADVALYLLGLGLRADASRTVIAGQLHAGAFSGVVRNAASIVSWGDWQPPNLGGTLDLDQRPAAVRDQVRRGAFRRSAATGGPLGVHVIDLGRSTSHRPHGDAGTDAHVAAHLRRGHWRRVRVGPRHDWHYEGRWIAPTVVNAGSGDAPDVIYRLPAPPTTTARADETEDDLTT